MKKCESTCRLFIYTFITWILASCSSYSIHNPNSGSPLILASLTEKCEPAKSFPQWYALYGMIPITSLNSGAMFSSANSSYRITQKPSYLDIAVSLIGGVSLSITRKTLLVEQCTSKTKFVSETKIKEMIEQERKKQILECDKRLDQTKASSKSETDSLLNQEKERQQSSCAKKLKELETNLSKQCDTQIQKEKEACKAANTEKEEEQ